MTGRTRLNNVNVLLNDAEMAAIHQLKQHTGLSLAGLVRQLIKQRAAMTLRGTPLCSDGSSCHCPHMHQRFPDATAQAPSNAA
jgi:hypothetical protein